MKLAKSLGQVLLKRALTNVVLTISLAMAAHRATAATGSGKLYVAFEGAFSGVTQSNLDGSNLIELDDSLCTPVGLAVDGQHGKIYMSCVGPGQVCSANLDGSDFQAITPTSVASLNGVAVDPAGGYLYWTVTYYGTPCIMRSNLDGSNPVKFITGGMSSPAGLALDLVDRKIYWTDAQLGTVDEANLDGTGARTIETNGGSGVAVDPQHGKLYWVSYGSQQGIWDANLDGSDAQPLILGLGTLDGVALDVPDGKLYFTDSVFDAEGIGVWEADLNGTGLVQLPWPTSISRLEIAPYGLAVYSVPEPTTLTLLGSALLGFGVVYMRRRRGAKA
jgi:DNA-binding beta-propeller fold protein YncE